LPVLQKAWIVGFMATQPTGTVTLLFSDVEGSTRLLDRLGTERYEEVLQLHRRLLREAFARHDGYEFGTEGDALFVAFASAPDAVAAAEEGQQALAGASWPDDAAIKVRMGIHTGEPLASEANYVGMDVHRAARIVAVGHGGQALVSETTAALLDATPLKDLGPHRLKDLLEPIRLHQLVVAGLAAEFPPLRSLHRTNLPVPGTPFLGRDEELRELGCLLTAEEARVVTVTGPGGVGKTRLSLQAAVESAEAFPDGLFWVALAPLRDPLLLTATLAQALEVVEQPERTVTESVIAALKAKRALLVVDNCEHLLDAVAELARRLVQECPRLVVVCSSRERLGLRSERVFPVPPMTGSDGEALFLERARAVEPRFAPDEHVPAICAALDELPLAIELAAARVRSLSTAAVRERLAERLSLLTSRDRDRDERQRTLEATIAWSYDLLDAEEQRVLRALAVFAGGCALEAAETVAGADLDLLESLLDKSLLRHRSDEADEDRYWLLETIREYAAARLQEAGEGEVVREAHRAYFLERAAALSGDGFRHDGSEVPLFRADRGNYRVVLLEALAGGDATTALSLVASLAHIWHRAGEVADGYRLAKAALALAGGKELDRGRAAHLAGDMAVDLGEHHEAARLLDEAEEVAISLDDLDLLYRVQYTRSYLCGAGSDYAAAAEWAHLAVETGRKRGSEAAELDALQMELQFMRVAASDRDEVDRPTLECCLATGERLLGQSRSLGNPLTEAFLYEQLAFILFALSRHEDALRHAQAALRLRQTTLTSLQAMGEVFAIGLICGGLGDHPTAMKLVTAALRAYESEGFKTDSEDDRNLARLEADARQALGSDAYEAALRAGEALTIEQAAELALDFRHTEDHAARPERAGRRSDLKA
jgi:predicted ATPase/class 3 adenylate cyclase